MGEDQAARQPEGASTVGDKVEMLSEVFDRNERHTQDLENVLARTLQKNAELEKQFADAQVQCLGMRYTLEQIDIILRALREEAGREYNPGCILATMEWLATNYRNRGLQLEQYDSRVNFLRTKIERIQGLALQAFYQDRP